MSFCFIAFDGPDGLLMARACAAANDATGGFMAGFLFFAVLALLGVAGRDFRQAPPGAVPGESLQDNAGV